MTEQDQNTPAQSLIDIEKALANMQLVIDDFIAKAIAFKAEVAQLKAQQPRKGIEKSASIIQYLQDKDRVCAPEILFEVFGLKASVDNRYLLRKIHETVKNTTGWKPCKSKLKFENYGILKGYVKW